MHFTEGEPFIVYADIFDSRNAKGFIICPAGQTISNQSPAPDYSTPRMAECSGGGTPVGYPQFQLLIDGIPQTDTITGGTTVPHTLFFNHDLNPDPIGYFPFNVASVPAGMHQVVARGLFSMDGTTVATQDSYPISIVVDPVPAKTVIQLDGTNSSGTIN